MGGLRHMFGAPEPEPWKSIKLSPEDGQQMGVFGGVGMGIQMGIPRPAQQMGMENS